MNIGKIYIIHYINQLKYIYLQHNIYFATISTSALNLMYDDDNIFY